MKRYYIIAIITFPLSFVIGLSIVSVFKVQSPTIGTIVIMLTLFFLIAISLKIADKYWGEKRFDFQEETISNEEYAKLLIAHTAENLDHEMLENTDVYWSDEQERFIVEKKEKMGTEPANGPDYKPPSSDFSQVIQVVILKEKNES